MGVGQSAIDAIARWAVRRSSYAPSAPRVDGGSVSGMPLWSDWSTERAIKDGYKAHYALYAVTSDLASCIRSVPWNLYRRTTDGAEVVDTHPLAEFIRRPNGQETWGALMEAWDTYKSLSGNAYGLVSQAGDSVQVWKLRPDRMKPIPDKKGYVARWEYTVDGAPDYFKPEDILHFKFFDPGNDHLGMAPLQAAAHLIDTSNAGIGSNKALVNNLGRPGGMFNPDGSVPPLSEEQLSSWVKSIKAQTTGKNRGQYLVNPFAASFQHFEFTPVELDYLNSFVTYENGIYKAFHVLPEAMGAESTYENKRWAIREKWNGPVTTRLREMRGVLNHRFSDAFGTAYPAAVGDLYLDYDLTDTPAVQEQRKELIEAANKVWAMGVPWDVIDREMDLGFGPQPGGDTGYISSMTLPVGASPVTESRSKLPDDHRAAYWRATDRRKQGWERGVAEKAKDLFAAERGTVVKAIEGGTLDVEYLIDANREAWERLLYAVYRAIIEDFGLIVNTQLTGRADGDFDPWTDHIQDFVTRRTAEQVTLIQTTTKDAIRKVVLSGVNDGLSITKIARQVRESMENASVYRSVMIARTEVHAAAGYAMHESAKQSGVAQEKHWLDSGDERVRDSHAGNTAAGWIRFDEAYPNGAMYPGDGTDDINCRCTEMYRAG